MPVWRPAVQAGGAIPEIWRLVVPAFGRFGWGGIRDSARRGRAVPAEAGVPSRRCHTRVAAFREVCGVRLGGVGRCAVRSTARAGLETGVPS
ncbi:MAG: hypothetical protein OXG44_10235, partial [Gammaproteobacteria bacterium]|nr:hypothetical protein [Gammaproteobacteria bacterium]